MKKIVLILSLFFASVGFVNASNQNFTNLSPQKVESVSPSFCWDFAEYISNHFHEGSFEWFEYAYDTCMELVQ